MNLLDYKYDKYSSCGNDGIIEKIFDILGVEIGVFVEFGAWDGIKGSNCKKLHDEGWEGVFIEPDSSRYKELCANYDNDNSIVCIKSFVDNDKNKLDDLLDNINGINEIDFCSIDIDGLDLEIFESIEKYRPKVVCMEGGQMLHPYHKVVPRNIAKKNIQQSISSINDVARKKGYRILCTYQDTFLVTEELYSLFQVESDVMSLYMDGIKSIPRRLPWIKKQLKRVGLENEIINVVLTSCNYDSYGWSKRKEWAKKELPLINRVVEELKNEHKNKTTS